MVMLTVSERRGLEVVRDNPRIRPGRFARKMWPDSPCWDQHYPVRGGVVMGGGMFRAGGSYLGRLRAKGLLIRSDRHGAFEYEVSYRGSLELAQAVVKDQP